MKAMREEMQIKFQQILAKINTAKTTLIIMDQQNCHVSDCIFLSNR